MGLAYEAWERATKGLGEGVQSARSWEPGQGRLQAGLVSHGLATASWLRVGCDRIKGLGAKRVLDNLQERLWKDQGRTSLATPVPSASPVLGSSGAPCQRGQHSSSLIVGHTPQPREGPG